MEYKTVVDFLKSLDIPKENYIEACRRTSKASSRTNFVNSPLIYEWVMAGDKTTEDLKELGASIGNIFDSGVDWSCEITPTSDRRWSEIQTLWWQYTRRLSKEQLSRITFDYSPEQEAQKKAEKLAVIKGIQMNSCAPFDPNQI